MHTSTQHITISAPKYENMTGGHTGTTLIDDAQINNHRSVLTSADGPIVTPAYIAVCHSETADAL